MFRPTAGEFKVDSATLLLATEGIIVQRQVLIIPSLLCLLPSESVGLPAPNLSGHAPALIRSAAAPTRVGARRVNCRTAGTAQSRGHELMN